MKTWTFIDKTGWGEGAFQNEPDKCQWTDEATGLPCLIVRNHFGALCGYVGVPEGHPFFDIGCDESNNQGIPVETLNVHGGVTFTGFCQEDKEHGICHVPEVGQSDRVFWLGFDCAHYYDLTPAARLPTWGQQTYRDVEYVTAQVRTLALQLKFNACSPNCCAAVEVS